MRKLVIAALVGLVVCTSTGAHPAAAQSETQYYVVDLVNQLRAEYGLPPYRVDPALMAAAQAHSEWAASMGTHSHTGVGGSTPQDRAIAAGYGGGKSVRVSENIYWGTMATAESALEWWRNSDIHFRGMTSTQYVDIGAGVAYGDAGGFFTLNFGVITGEAPPPPASSASGSGVQPLPEYVIEPIEKAEPNEDGSVVHVVGEGQTLWGISEAYEVPLSEIMALNRLTEDSIIRPGDEIVVVRAPIQANAQPEGPVVHTVALGQTLFEIALTYGVDLQTVLDLNGLTEASIIRPGDEIVVVPAPGETYPKPKPAIVHAVEPGQTLLEIALIYGVELQTLLELNNLSADSLIMPGDQILIRPADPTPVPTEQTVPSPTPDIVQTQSAEALRLPTPELGESSAGPERALEQESRATRPLLIAVLVVAALLGAGLLVAGIVLKPGPRQEESDD